MAIFLYKEIIAKDLSVRQVEAMVKNWREGKFPTKNEPKELPKEFSDLKEQLVKHFDSKVSLQRNDGGKGKITIPFDSNEDLKRIINILNE